MCESASFSTLILDLSSYYQDYREKTRILFRQDFQTIQDVKQRISELFNISDFYLSSESFYLPESESVKILSNNPIISVKPIRSNGLIEKGDILSNKWKKSEKNCNNDSYKVNNKADEKLSKSSSTNKEEKNGLFLYNNNNNNKESDNRSIRLSRQTDPLNYRKFIPPQQNTQEYLEKKKINIISINVVNKTKTTTADEDNNDGIVISEPLVNDVNDFSTVTSNNKSDDFEIILNNEKENLEINDDDLNLTPLINNSKNKNSTCVGGVGSLLSALRNPSEEISSDTSFESSKRKRIRKRKRPASNKVESNEDLGESSKSLLQRPCTLINGNPKIHVKFPDEVKINDFEYLTEEYLDDLPIMDIKSIQIYDIIAFKHLISSSDITETPKRSNNYMLGEIMEIEKMGEEILLFNMKIIRDLNDIPKSDKIQESKEEEIKSFYSVNMIDIKIVYFTDL